MRKWQVSVKSWGDERVTNNLLICSRGFMDYIVEVERDIATGSGRLSYHHSDTSVDTTCWFQLKDPIPEKRYTGCSATHMQTKKNSKGEKREGIYIPDEQTGREGIFIHMGTDCSWSEGCIVIEESEVLKMWHSIEPKDAKNVMVIVKNT